VKTRDEDDVINQADALMRRYRSFVARSAEDLAPSADTAATETEIPVLTEIVNASEIAPQDLDGVLAELQEQIDAAISAWLIEVLPAAVANASQQILAELDAKASSTLLPQLRELIEAHRQHGD
jgi:hypothetical protein